MPALADLILDPTRVTTLAPAEASNLIAQLVQLGRELLSVRQQLVAHLQRIAANN